LGVVVKTGTAKTGLLQSSVVKTPANEGAMISTGEGGDTAETTWRAAGTE
jgi:hypothetical protein